MVQAPEMLQSEAGCLCLSGPDRAAARGYPQVSRQQDRRHARSRQLERAGVIMRMEQESVRTAIQKRGDSGVIAHSLRIVQQRVVLDIGLLHYSAPQTFQEEEPEEHIRVQRIVKAHADGGRGPVTQAARERT